MKKVQIVECCILQFRALFLNFVISSRKNAIITVKRETELKLKFKLNQTFLKIKKEL